MPLAPLAVPAIELVVPAAISTSTAAIAEAKIAIPIFAAKAKSLTRYAVVKGYGVYKTVTASEIFITNMEFYKLVINIPAVQYFSGIGVGIAGEYNDALPPDFSTGLEWFNFGKESGSLFYRYAIAPIIDLYYEKKDKQKNSD